MGKQTCGALQLPRWGGEQELNLAAITFDVDWAPEWAIRECHYFCEKMGISATFYVTHASDAVDEMRAEPRFELGIHPNFLPGSTQGDSEREVLEYCLGLVPDARAMRTHALVQSSRLYEMVGQSYPCIDSDSSIFLPGTPGIRPTAVFFGAATRPLVRMPYFWCDQYWAKQGARFNHAPRAEWTGLRVFDIHPVLFALNVSKIDSYENMKASMSGKPLNHATREDIAPFVNYGPGSVSFIEQAVSAIGAEEFSNSFTNY